MDDQQHVETQFFVFAPQRQIDHATINIGNLSVNLESWFCQTMSMVMHIDIVFVYSLDYTNV